MCNLQAYIDELNEKLAKVSRERDDLARMVKEQAEGHDRWVSDGHGIFCSACDHEAITEWDEFGGRQLLTPYCPYCGKRLIGERIDNGV